MVNDLLNTYRSLLQVNIALSLIQTLWSSLQYVLSLTNLSSPIVAWWQTPIMSSASVLTFLPAGNCPTTNSFKVKVILRLAVYRQSVRLRFKPLETHDQRYFQLNPCGHSNYVTSFLMRRWVCLLWICLAFCPVYVSHMLLKFFLLQYINEHSQYKLCEADHA
jgi:hypothetical protein